MPVYPRVLQQYSRLVRSGIVALILTLPSFGADSNTELPSLGENSTINIKRETGIGRSVYEQLLARGYNETHP